MPAPATKLTAWRGVISASRAAESALLARCAAVARDTDPVVQDQREANVFLLAAKVIRSDFPRESENLMKASERYFAIHPDERIEPGEVIRRGWIYGLPRLRDMLERQFLAGRAEIPLSAQAFAGHA